MSFTIYLIFWSQSYIFLEKDQPLKLNFRLLANLCVSIDFYVMKST